MRMIQIELLKSFGSWIKGTVRAVSAQRANYWERIGLAKRYEKPKGNVPRMDNPPKPPKKKEKQKSNDKSRTTQQSKE